MKRYVIYKDVNTVSEALGEANNVTQICKVIGCSKTHYYNNFNGKYIVKEGQIYTIIDKASYYHEGGNYINN